MRVVIFWTMCHIFAFSRGLRGHSLLSIQMFLLLQQQFSRFAHKWVTSLSLVDSRMTLDHSFTHSLTHSLTLSLTLSLSLSVRYGSWDKSSWCIIFSFKNYVYETTFGYLEPFVCKMLDYESSHLTLKHNRHFVPLLDGVFRELTLSGCSLYYRSVLWM